MNNVNENRPNPPSVRRDPLSAGKEHRSAIPENRRPHTASSAQRYGNPQRVSGHHTSDPDPRRQERSHSSANPASPNPAHEHGSHHSNTGSSHHHPQPAKPQSSALLYVIISVLSVLVVFMGVITFLSLFRLNQMSEKLLLLEDSMDAISSDIDTVSTQAETLTALNEQYDALDVSDTASTEGEIQGPVLSPAQEAEAETEETKTDTEKEQGTLSPSSESSSALDDPSYDDFLHNSVIPQVANHLPTTNGSWSVYIANLALDDSDSINSHRMQAASLIKLFIMGAVYERYDEMISAYGIEDVDYHLKAMITISDNDSANTLVRWLGGDDETAGRGVVNDFCNRHGYSDTTMGRMLLADTSTGDNITSVKDCGNFLREVYRVSNGYSSPIQLTHCSDMLRLLSQQERRHKIPAGIPDGVSVANKTGELADVENDAAIIYNTEKDIDLVIVFMSEDLTDTGSAQGTISALSGDIYGAYNQDSM